MSETSHHIPTSLSAEKSPSAAAWTTEQLVAMDWKRLAEILRAVGIASGFTIRNTRLELDGSCQFTMSQGLGKQAANFLVLITPWNQWMANATSIENFAYQLQKRRNYEGIFMAPLGFTPSAMLAAKKLGIEMLDALTLAKRLSELPYRRGSIFHDLGANAHLFIPTCPACLKPLLRREETPETSANVPHLSYSENKIVAESLTVGRLEILRRCEVQFLREVHARDVIIHGIAIGDFVCDGTLLMNPGSQFFGTVAAKSIFIRPGAVMNGTTRILDEKPEPVNEIKKKQVWRCENPQGNEACNFVHFLPH